jgi:hypothetical protein
MEFLRKGMFCLGVQARYTKRNLPDGKSSMLALPENMESK